MEIKTYSRTILRYLYYICLLPFCWLSRIFPRDDTLWVFGAWKGRRYSDNAKYLFEYVQHEKDIKTVWISKDKDVVDQVRKCGYYAFSARSLYGIYYMLRAGVAIVSSGLADLSGFLICGAFKVNSWHGAPMKKLYFDQEIYVSEGAGKKYVRELILSIIPHSTEIKTYDLILATSDYFKPIMASAFRVPKTNVKVLGYPRNDVFFEENHRSYYMENLRDRFRCRNILAYLPTYRFGDDRNGVSKLFSNYGFKSEKMTSFLKGMDSILLIKLHYVEQQRKKNIKFNLGSRIVYADQDEVADINDILSHIDVLITDYSGVYFDYLLFNRPVIFAAFDLEEYAGDRGLYQDYRFYIAGPIAKNWCEVMSCVKDAILNPAKYEELRIEKNRIFNKYCDGKSSKRVRNYLKGRMIEGKGCGVTL